MKQPVEHKLENLVEGDAWEVSIARGLLLLQDQLLEGLVHGEVELVRPHQ